jgi:heat shock protein HtpX
MDTTISQHVTLGGLFLVWLLSAGLSEILFASGLNSVMVATKVTFVLALIVAAASRTLHVVFGLGFVAVFALFIHILAPFVQLFFRYTLWVPAVSLVDYAGTVSSMASLIIVGLVGLFAASILYTVRKTRSAVGWSFVLRMVASLLVLALLLIGFFTVMWRTTEILIEICLFFLGIELDTRVFIARLVTFGVLTGFVSLELGRISTVDQHGEAAPVTPEEYPDLHSVTTRIASQFDIPHPTIAVAERSEPEAITVGYRPENIHLILSQGLIDALDNDELEAVIAHELAHVANLDAMVTTVASLPSFFADDLQALAGGWIDDDNPLFIFLFIGVVTEYVSRPVVSVLSRTRESAADRTAATVIGSPAALASALRTLDEQIAATPSEDLREASSLSSLSILPLDPLDADTDIRESDGLFGFSTLLIPDGWESVGVVGMITSGLMWIKWKLFATHPSTDRRIDALDALTEGETEP